MTEMMRIKIMERVQIQGTLPRLLRVGLWVVIKEEQVTYY